MVRGEIFYVAADLRRGSPNILAGGTQRFFPEITGTSFGFQVVPLTVSAYFPADYTVCKAKDYYRSECERTLMWNDSEQRIDWQLDSEPVVPAKDASDSWLQAAEVFDWGSLKCQDLTTPRSHQNTKAHPWVRY